MIIPIEFAPSLSVLMEKSLPVVVMIRLFVYGTLAPVSISKHFRVIPIESGLSLLVLMEESLPVVVQIRPFAYGTSTRFTVSNDYMVIYVGCVPSPSVLAGPS